jgi:anion-transporting  ArsA/GET3 family ATPase
MGKVTVFCGKGGVGKTTLSLAFAFWNAVRNRKTVVVTSHPLTELAVSISLHGLKESYPAAAANMFIIHIDPREILSARVRQQIPSEFLSRAVLSSSIYSNLIEVAPGLKELAFLARLKQLAEARTQGGSEGDFDVLVWDAPSTGHFLQTMKVSREFHTYLTGPFSLSGGDLTRFFSDPGNITAIPVTILEEMAVQETIELWQKLDREFLIRPSAVVCNLSSPALPVSDEEFRQLCSRFASDAPGAASMTVILDRHAAERELFHKLKRSVEGPFCFVRRTARWSSDLDLLSNLSDQLGQALPTVQ